MLEIRERDAQGNLKPPKAAFEGGKTTKQSIAELEEEKLLLLASMMELSSFAAMQQQIIDAQTAAIEEQNSAIMELSTLVAMQLMGGEEDV